MKLEGRRRGGRAGHEQRRRPTLVHSRSPSLSLCLCSRNRFPEDMPLSVAQVNAVYGHYTPAMVAPFPESRLTKQQALDMLKVSTQV